jgi:hypothetical protein
VATAGVEVIEALGTERIRAHSLAAMRRLPGAALAAGLAVSTPVDDDERDGTIAIGSSDAEAAVRKLGVSSAAAAVRAALPGSQYRGRAMHLQSGR